MSTITTYKRTGSPGIVGKTPLLHQFVMNFATVNVTQNDIIEMFQCPEDFSVTEAGYEVLISATGSTAIDVGKAGGTELLSAIALDAAVGTKGAQSFTTPVFFKDSDTIDVQITGATAILGKVRIWWVGIDVSEMNLVNDLVS